MDSDNEIVHGANEYLGGHSVLFKGHDKLTKDTVVGMGELTLDPAVKLKTKEVILMILAHHPSKEALEALREYNKNPDKGMEYFSQLALEECEWWNE